jgi:abortive infection bacteriophage resistance protein
MKQPFTKPAETYQQQVQRLMMRGMHVEDKQQAAFYLEHLNYYRLAAYWRPDEADHQTHRFQPDTSFQNILRRYEFDRQLRLHLMDALDRIEVSIRSRLAYELAHRHGPHAHLEVSLAKDAQRWQADFKSLSDAVQRSKEPFIQHFVTNYTEPLPPIWACCEVMSLGLLSKWYDNLKPMPTRNAIAHTYGIDQGMLASWLRHLTVVRNICAHHARLWKRRLTVTPQHPKGKPSAIKGCFVTSNHLYNTLVLQLYCMDVIAPDHSWRNHLKSLLLDHSPYLPDMGFPHGWQQQPIWQ